MKISATIIAALGMATLAACGSGTGENASGAMEENVAIDETLGMTTDANMAIDADGAINGADGLNSTENAMANDLTTNDADTNLANGM